MKSAAPLFRGAGYAGYDYQLHVRDENAILPFLLALFVSNTIVTLSSSSKELLRLNNGDLGMHVWELSSFGE